MLQKLPLFILICFFGSVVGHAQNRITFNEVNAKNTELDGKFKRYKILELDDDLQRISDGQTITINLDQDYSFTLKENRILTHNYTTRIAGEAGVSSKSLTELGFDGQYFTNQNTTAYNQLAFSMFEGRYRFYVKQGAKEFYIEPVKDNHTSGVSGQYVYYEVKDIIPSAPFGCGLTHEKEKSIPIQAVPNRTSGGCKTVTLQFAIDYSMYETLGNVNAAINRTLEILNLSQLNYTIANGLSDEVHFKVDAHYIVTCDTCNNWPTTLEISDNYDQFYFTSRYVMFADPQNKIAVLWQNQGGTGDIGGLANGNGFTCGLSGVMVVKNFADDNDLTRQILSHEMGHNLHCDHTDGFIMNPAVNYTTSWAPESIATINNTVNTVACITDCNELPCETKRVAGLSYWVDTTSDLVTYSWVSEPGMSYKVRSWNLSGGGNDFTTLSYPANSIAYPVSQVFCTDKYRFFIIPVCDGVQGLGETLAFQISQDVAAPTIVGWSGFTDYFGGPFHAYSPLCSGKTYQCSITAFDGGTNPVYQWRVNGAAVGTNSDTLIIDTLQNNDIVSCELTSNAACVGSPTAVFSTTVSVVDPIPLEVTLSNTSNTSICLGDAVTIDQFIASNGYWNQAWIDAYYNGVMIESVPLFDGFFGFYRTFSFTPTESGVLYFNLLAAQDQQGNAIGCYLNQNVVTMPIQITVNTPPCDLANTGFEVSGLGYYPNPVRDVFNLRAKELINEVSIYNVQGQLVSHDAVQSATVKLDLSSLATGMYFIKVTANGKVENVKVVKL